MLKCQRKVVSDDAKKFNSQHASFIANHSLTQQGHTHVPFYDFFIKRGTCKQQLICFTALSQKCVLLNLHM